jgi:hypothetical protein
MGSVVPFALPPAPQRGHAGAATIADLMEAGRGLIATCEVCLHSARLNLPVLAARLGPAHGCSEAALRPHLQCSVCKSVDSSLEETRPSRHGTRRPASRSRIPRYV